MTLILMNCNYFISLDNKGVSRVTIAVVLGVGLTVVIFACLGYFLCREHFEQKQFKNHRQLLKMERLKKVTLPNAVNKHP